MAVTLTERALILLRLRTERAASAAAIAGDLGLDVDEVLATCEELRAADLVEPDDDRVLLRQLMNAVEALAERLGAIEQLLRNLHPPSTKTPNVNDD